MIHGMTSLFQSQNMSNNGHFAVFSEGSVVDPALPIDGSVGASTDYS
jgi:hypothetical protein